jgi:hypothetical protein
MPSKSKFIEDREPVIISQVVNIPASMIVDNDQQTV